MEPVQPVNFFQLPHDKCISLYPAITENGNSLLRISQYCFQNRDFGAARALAILGCEEWIKATLLFLRGKGFHIHLSRELTSAITKSHAKRHDVAAMVQAILMVQRLFFAKKKPSKKTTARRYFTSAFNTFLDVRTAIDLFDWWKDAERFKQRGFYVDYENKLLTPSDISKDECQIAFAKIDLTIENLNELKRKIETELTPGQLRMINEGLQLNETMRNQRTAKEKQGKEQQHDKGL